MEKKILNFSVVFEPEEGGGYSVFVPQLPGCVTQGDTFEHAQTMAKEAITLYLEVLTERKEPLPEQSDAPVIGSVSVDLADVHP
jgi:predicted RNase H-like HicB family nuclease